MSFRMFSISFSSWVPDGEEKSETGVPGSLEAHSGWGGR